MLSGLSLLKTHMDEDVPREDMLNELNTQAAKVPSEVAMGLSDRGIADLGRGFNGLVLGMLASKSVELKDTATLSSVHAQLAKLLKRGGYEGLALFAKLSSEEMAKGVFGMVHKEASNPKLNTPPGVKVKVSDDLVHVTIDVSKLVSDADLTQLLVNLEIVPDETHPGAALLVGALKTIRQEVWLQRIGSGIKLAFGPKPKRARALKAKKLGPAFRATPSDMVWARTDMKAWTKVIKAIDATASAYEDSAAMRALLKEGGLNINSFMMSSTMEALRRGELGKAMHARVWGEDAAFKILTIQEGAKKGDVLAKSPLSQLIPGSSTMVQAHSLLSLQSELSALSEILSLALNAADLGEAEHIETLSADLSKLLKDQADGVVARGAATIVGWGGDIEKMRILRVSADGTQKTLEGKRLPHYGIAFMVPLERGADGLAFGGKMLEVTGKSLCALIGGKLSEDARFSAATKLGLGTPTIALPWTAMSACKVSDSALQVDISGDLLLHAFQLEDVLIISSSRALSTRIAATHAGAHTRYALPKPPKGIKGKLVGFERATGNALASWVDALRLGLDRLQIGGTFISDAGRGTLEEGPDAGSPVPDGPVTRSLKLAAETLRLITNIESVYAIKGRVLSGLSTIAFQGK